MPGAHNNTNNTATARAESESLHRELATATTPTSPMVVARMMLGSGPTTSANSRIEPITHARRVRRARPTAVVATITEDATIATCRPETAVRWLSPVAKKVWRTSGDINDVSPNTLPGISDGASPSQLPHRVPAVVSVSPRASSRIVLRTWALAPAMPCGSWVNSAERLEDKVIGMRSPCSKHEPRARLCVHHLRSEVIRVHEQCDVPQPWYVHRHLRHPTGELSHSTSHADLAAKAPATIGCLLNQWVLVYSGDPQRHRSCCNGGHHRRSQSRVQPPDHCLVPLRPSATAELTGMPHSKTATHANTSAGRMLRR